MRTEIVKAGTWRSAGAALALTGLAIAAAVVWWPHDPAASAPGTASVIALPAVGGAPLPASTEPCERVLRCAADRAMQLASERCRPAIEQLAVYRPRWTLRDEDPIFTDSAWLDAARGTFTYFGNRAEFQNASGAYVRVAYECDWDPAKQSVISARVRGGALN